MKKRCGGCSWPGYESGRKTRPEGAKRPGKTAHHSGQMRNYPNHRVELEEFESINDAFDHCRDHREKSVEIITNARPCQD
jgi:hypothetical protein